MIFEKLKRKIAEELLSGQDNYANELFKYRPAKKPIYAELVLKHKDIIVCGPLHSPPTGVVYTTKKDEISAQLQLYLGDNLVLAQIVPKTKGCDVHTLFLVNIPEPGSDIPLSYVHPFNDIPHIKEAPRKLIESASSTALDTIVRLKTDRQKYVIFESEFGKDIALAYFRELK